MSAKLNISIVPAGVWGTALAIPLADNGHQVKLYFRSKAESDQFNKTLINESKFPSVRLPTGVSSTHLIEEAIRGVEIVVLAAKVQQLRKLFSEIKPLLSPKMIVVCIAKGLEEGTHLRVSEILEQLIPGIDSRLGILSGPNFAVEVINRFPTATIVASKNKAVSQKLQTVFTTERFRVYLQDDVYGVELGGALKNVIAIAVGIGDGLGIGENGRAALITRGLAQMTRLGVSLGAKASTFAGLSGLGDLILTCSLKSRNYKAGLAIGQGTNPQDLLSSEKTIEGLHTISSAMALAKKAGIRVSIIEKVYEIVHQGLDPKQAMEQLLSKELSYEAD